MKINRIMSIIGVGKNLLYFFSTQYDLPC